MSPPPRNRSSLHAAGVRLRRIVVRHPWIHWAIVVLAATGTAASALDHADRVDAARRSWGETTTVYVASHALEPGDEAAFTPTQIPSALAGEHVATAALLDAAIARQHVAAGEVISVADVATQSGPAALIPDGWLGVPVVESPASGAGPGDPVLVASDGIVIAAEAVVAGHVDGITIVAVPADVAPLLPLAADAGSLTLLLTP